MKRHIIVYYGKQNSGKTTTLTLLHNMLAMALPQCNNQPCPIPTPDFRSCFVNKGYVICISTGGDDACAICQGLGYFEEQLGHILVIAARSRGKTVKLLREYEEQHSDVDIVWVSAHVAPASEHYKQNRKAASKLLCITEKYFVEFLEAAARFRMEKLERQIDAVRKEMQSPQGATYVMYDTCAYRTIVQDCTSDEDVIQEAQKYRQLELAAGIRPIVTGMTLWELVAHITETDEQGQKTLTRISCERALLFIHHHVQGSFTAIPECDAAAGMAAKSDNPFEVIKVDSFENAYNISTHLYSVVRDISNYITLGYQHPNYAIIEMLARDMVEWKESIKATMQKLANEHSKTHEEFNEVGSEIQDEEKALEKETEKLCEDLEMDIARALLNGVNEEYQTVENYKILFPVTSLILTEHIFKWCESIYSGKCGRKWAKKKKIANLIVDAIQLAPVSAQCEANAAYIVSADSDILAHRDKLVASNHKIISLEEHKQQLGI